MGAAGRRQEERERKLGRRRRASHRIGAGRTPNGGWGLVVGGKGAEQERVGPDSRFIRERSCGGVGSRRRGRGGSSQQPGREQAGSRGSARGSQLARAAASAPNSRPLDGGRASTGGRQHGQAYEPFTAMPRGPVSLRRRRLVSSSRQRPRVGSIDAAWRRRPWRAEAVAVWPGENRAVVAPLAAGASWSSAPNPPIRRLSHPGCLARGEVKIFST
jgi:hypothetical protein